jgi:hypothetical protein
MRSVATVLVAVLGGFLAGTAGTAFMNRHQAAKMPSAEEGARTGSVEGRAQWQEGTATMDRVRLSRLESQVSAMQEPPPTAGTPRKAPGPEERARRVAEEFQYHQGLIQKNADAARNDQWATKMETALNGMLQRVPPGTAKMKIEGVDCRTDTCAVNVSWPSRQVAENELRVALNVVAGSRCGREVALPPPSTGDGEVRTAIMLQCNAGSGLAHVH